MSDAIKALRSWQERVRGQAPFVVPEYEDFARMVEGMEKDADTIEALQAENAKMRAIISALEKYQAGELLEPPRTGRPKTALTTQEKPE